MSKTRLQAFREVRHIDQPRYPWFDDADRLEDGVLYVVDGEQQDGDQLIEYNCPCGCGKTVMIPYYRAGQKKEEIPSWTYREENGRATLSPSIYSTSWPCKSHYSIRENKIIWC